MRRRWQRFAAWTLALLAAPATALFVGAGPAAAGGSCHSAATAAEGTKVFISELCFGPTVLYVKPGASVTWTNKDSIEHTVTGLGFQWGTDGNLGEGQAFSSRFASPGVYPYACVLHPGMVAAVVVGDAGSPDAAQGISVPGPVQNAPPAASARKPASPVKTQPASSGLWRAVSVAALALLLGAGVTIALQRRRMLRERSGATA